MAKTYNDALEWAAQWIEDTLKAGPETNERTIEFGTNMAMTLRAAKLPQPAPDAKGEWPIDEVVKSLFTNGAGEEADRLLLIKEPHSGAAKVSNAKNLGGYSRAAVRSILKDAFPDTALASTQEKQ